MCILMSTHNLNYDRKPSVIQLLGIGNNKSNYECQILVNVGTQAHRIGFLCPNIYQGFLQKVVHFYLAAEYYNYLFNKHFFLSKMAANF